jgi:sulfite reductase (NADPH) hemoprotein beta-component
MLRRYASERLAGERFGDFAIRIGLITPTGTPSDFHDKAQEKPAAQPAMQAATSP